MASTMVKSYKMKRSETKKSHSWWWDSHVSPKNSKWLQENLEEMDQNVKRMIKLIEEDGDSFAKKAEMYYQKRPELIHLVEEFYRMYRSLAERYDNVTGELRKNVPSDLQSQGSGISETCSEPPSVIPPADQRPTRRRSSGVRAAGFDFFLGTGGNSSEIGSREGDETSTLDSESESSDDSSVVNYSAVHSNDDDQGSRKKINDLEAELRDVKEKLRTQPGEIPEFSSASSKSGDNNLHSKIEGYEEELRNVKEKLGLSEEEVNRLKTEITVYESMKVSDHKKGRHSEVTELLEESSDGSEAELKIVSLEEELKNTKEKLHESENEVETLKEEMKNSLKSLQIVHDQLGSVKKDSSSWKVKLNKEEREVSKLQDRITRYKSNISDRDQEIRRLKESIANANKSLSEENAQLQVEITKLLKDRSYLENNLKEFDHRCQSLEEDLRRVKEAKLEMEDEIEQLKTTLLERNGQIEELNLTLDAFRLKHDMLSAEKDELIAEMSRKEERINEMNKHLHQLHMEHVKLIAETEEARKSVEEERTRVQELEKEVERQQKAILEGAEEKREAIRQLCFSLEHYRDGYHQLRLAVTGGHKRFPVMAS